MSRKRRPTPRPATPTTDGPRTWGDEHAAPSLGSPPTSRPPAGVRGTRRRRSRRSAYVDAVARAGGRAVLLPPALGAAAETLNAVDALILCGGPDIDPSRLRAGARARHRAPGAAARRTRTGTDRRGAARRCADARDLSWHAAVERRARRDAGSGPPRPRHPSRRIRRPRDPDGARQSRRGDPRRPRDGDVRPPPGDRRARARAWSRSAWAPDGTIEASRTRAAASPSGCSGTPSRATTAACSTRS